MKLNKKNEPGRETTPEEERLSWHPVFYKAIQLELEAYGDALRFDYEHQLTTEPLRIDVLIIKKTKDTVIHKNIASIFRKVNIVEYKSPDDYISVKDFYKVYSYACLYTVLEDETINDLSLTFVTSRHPRNLLEHLQKVRGYKVEEKRPGIYTVEGDILPIQIIESRKLPAEENIWLKGLYHKLEVPDLEQITQEAQRQGEEKAREYLKFVIRANKEKYKEMLKMSRTAPTFEQILKEVGLVDKWEALGEARGEARGKETITRNLLKMGMPLEEIVQATELPAEKVLALAFE